MMQNKSFLGNTYIKRITKRSTSSQRLLLAFLIIAIFLFRKVNYLIFTKFGLVLLPQVQVNGILSTTEDHAIIQESNIFESRQAFLAFSQKHNYNFDTLRRAKHSSMMILYHLHTSNKHRASQNSSSLTCTACKKDVSTTIYFPCLLCPDYRACNGCYTKDTILRHLHLFPTLPSANGAPPKTVMVSICSRTKQMLCFLKANLFLSFLRFCF